MRGQLVVRRVEVVAQVRRVVHGDRVDEQAHPQLPGVRHRRQVERRAGERPERVVRLDLGAGDVQRDPGAPQVGRGEVHAGRLGPGDARDHRRRQQVGDAGEAGHHALAGDLGCG